MGATWRATDSTECDSDRDAHNYDTRDSYRASEIRDSYRASEIRDSNRAMFVYDV